MWTITAGQANNAPSRQLFYAEHSAATVQAL